MSTIPEHVVLLCDFVNTVELDEEGSDRIATPGGLAAWLRERGLADARPTAAEVARATELREALRVLLMANNNLAVDVAPARAVVEDVSRDARVELVFAGDGTLLPVPRASGVRAALGTIVAAASLATQDGSWPRIKACRADDCHWAFWDEARNRSRAWCSMASCGNRAKVRAYRRRRSAMRPA